ncbi:D-isomer specific 2-hydroxyacid dehydrogenase NAD-binding protein [Gemmatirosa kalamazoonensis]|uniref:D-isomer specific 2-hydroxyacid dehydrogenase NAD-binding protein n=1 Tax=Gemmatirosa kalamazoonensis TaxID=861299 RepID=W0RE85_9BACT|nr:D-glycerate dehydrogenase [Gemmatirosa kalamazoonensis]AHG89126.1 D-isomer specific 2-hydroxyacid dehydrogenase NAD-binding protein [Gemmatirosa kalamazoonensis]
MRPLVHVTRRLPEVVERQLAAHFDVVLNETDAPLDARALADALAGADALLCTVTDRLDGAVLRGAAPLRARILVNFGVGYNHIDVGAARERGLVVTNTPGVLTDDTADVALALMLMTARRLGEGERCVRAGAWTGWTPTQLLGMSLSGKTLGIVGFGRIGRAMARRAHFGLGMRVRYLSRTVRPDAIEVGATPSPSLEALLAESDVVSIHVPATPETRHLVDADALAHMRPHAILVNTSRGDLVDEAALVAALRAGTIAGAGLDVYEGEPRIHPELSGMENVVLLPHLGSATRETRRAMGERALANLVAFFDGREPPDRVA